MGILLGLYLAVVLLAAPVISWRLAASGMIFHLGRRRLYGMMMRSSWLLALLGAAVLWWDGTLHPADVGLTLLPAQDFGIAFAGTLAAAAAAGGLFHALRLLLGHAESPAVLHLIPRTAPERRLWPAVALTAGLTEEFVFRGIAIIALARTALFAGAAGAQPGGVWLAAALVAVAFGLGHGYQDFLGMARAGTIGFILAVPFVVTGSLLPGILAHAVVDLILLLVKPPAAQETAVPTLPDAGRIAAAE